MQTDRPMVPYLEEALNDIVSTMMRIIINPTVLAEANTSYKLIKIDLSKTTNLNPSELIRLPTVTKALVGKAELLPQKKRYFLIDCQAMIIALLQKIQDKCPLKYGIARYASSLSPSKIVAQKERCREYFCNLVDKFCDGK